MTLIRFVCPTCGGSLSIDENATACAVTCPHCKNVIRPWGSELLDAVFVCPGCGTVLVVDRAYGGKKIVCPQCGSKVRVPVEPLEPAHLLESPPPAAASADPSQKRRTIRLTPEEIEMLTGG